MRPKKLSLNKRTIFKLSGHQSLPLLGGVSETCYSKDPRVCGVGSVDDQCLPPTTMQSTVGRLPFTLTRK